MHVTKSQVLINARANKVWEALTEPSLVKQWQYGSDVITDWKIGSSIKFHSEYNGIVYEQWGIILEFIPQKYVKYSLFAPRPNLEDKPENYFTMAYQLETQGSDTVLTITQEDPRQSEAENNEDNESGKAILEGLKNLVETQLV